jgi:hypothetical protein
VKSSVFLPAQQIFHVNPLFTRKSVYFGPAEKCWAGAGPEENAHLTLKNNHFQESVPAAQQIFASTEGKTFSHTGQSSVCENFLYPLYRNRWSAGPKLTKIIYEFRKIKVFLEPIMKFCWAGAGPVLGRCWAEDKGEIG